MNYSKILYFDTANSKGLSTTLWVSGCDHGCEGCFNKIAWDFFSGRPFTRVELDKIIESLRKPYINYFVISGGDPCHSNNMNEVTNICKKVKEETNVKIIVYTGYLMKDLWRQDNYKELFNNIDFMIDGKYDKNLPTKTLDLRGSTNQECWKFFSVRNERRFKNITLHYFRSE